MSVAVRAVVFDMDGVLIDSEELWNEARESLAREAGGRWHERAQPDMMGMSSTEWSQYMHDELAVPLAPEEIDRGVVVRMEGLYRERLPLIDGAREAVERLAARWPLAIASSANRELIDLALELAGLAGRFKASVSSEEVARGKPAPDVYLEAARRIDVDARECAAVEDSENGIRSAKAAGMRVVTVPNRAFPPSPAALAEADAVVPDLQSLDEVAITG